MIKKKSLEKAFLGLFVLLFFFGGAPAHADPTRDELEQQLKDIETQIANFESQLSTTKTQKLQLTAKIKELKTNQAVLRLQIKKTAIVIDRLNGQLTVTKKAIVQNILKTNTLEDQLAELFKQMNRGDDSLFLSVFGSGSIRVALQDIKNYSTLSVGIANITARTKMLKKELDAHRTKLGAQQDDAKDLLSVKTIQQKALADNLTEETTLLIETKGKEATYQNLLADTKKRAAAIRNRIYDLFEGNTTVNFGQAVAIAEGVSKQTGLRAAFLLAILSQESNLGKNVGTCNRKDDPPEKSWRVVMKPERDQEPFKKITDELILNIDITPVSCPLKDKNGNRYGWGGAMGPAQFIPSTWMGYKDKITAITGKTANPWDIRDAFLAAGLKLKAGGADNTKEGEWKAAMRYFSGGLNTRYRFYGDNVNSLTNKYIQDIADLNK